MCVCDKSAKANEQINANPNPCKAFSKDANKSLANAIYGIWQLFFLSLSFRNISALTRVHFKIKEISLTPLHTIVKFILYKIKPNV